MTGLTFTKSLIGIEDLLLGVHTQKQVRGGNIEVVTPIQILQPVNNLAELRMLDPNKFSVCLLLDDQTTDGTLKFSNEFYRYDFVNEEDEDFPRIIKSSVTEIGRWILCDIGKNRLTAQIVEEVENKTQNVENTVIFRLTPTITELVDDKVAETTAIFRKQGGVYYKRKDFSYNINNFIQSFTHKEGDIFGRLFLVKDEHNDPEDPLVDNPLQGDLYSDAGEVKIFEDNEDLKLNPAYVEVYPNHIRISEPFTLKSNKSYRFYTDTMSPRGTLRVRCLANGTVTASFDIVFAGMSYRDFYITNVIYSPVVKRTGLTSSYGYPFFPKFAIVANSVYMGLAVEDNQFCESIEFDYTNINIKPLVEEDNFSSLNSYAIRNGGGTYIQNLGDIVTSYKLNQDTTYGSFDFYLFSNGYQAYDKNIVLNRDIYHSYYEMGCLTTLADLSNMHFISATQSSPVAGTIQQPALPNVSWKGRLNAEKQYTYNAYAGLEDDFNRAGVSDAVRYVNQDRSTPYVEYDFNAQRDCSAIYQDGETTVKTLSMYVNRFIVCY